MSDTGQAHEFWLTHEFWVGLVILLSYQCAKFVELGTPGSLVTETHGIPNLRASDFIGPWTFATGLVTYLIATAFLFALACSAGPAIITALALLAPAADGAAPGAVIDGSPGSPSTLPIYIAALYMGLVQPQIPVLRRIGTVQRDIFHSFIGIPGRVLAASQDFNLAIASEDTGEDELRGLLRKLTSAAWRRTINPYADTGFYEGQLARLGLMEEGREQALRGSRREMLRDVRALVFAATLATTREEGGRALPRLAADLGIPDPDHGSRLQPAAACVLVVLALLIGVWTLMVVVGEVLPLQGWGYLMWPESSEEVRDAIVGQVVPLLISVGLALWIMPPPSTIPPGGMATGRTSWCARPRPCSRWWPLSWPTTTPGSSSW